MLLNIQMFIDASVRNGFDTLKTILKFFLFKIYTRVRRLSGSVRSRLGLFLREVSLVHKSNRTQVQFPLRAEGPTPRASSSLAPPLHTDRLRSSGVLGPGSSRVRSALIISLWS